MKNNTNNTKTITRRKFNIEKGVYIPSLAGSKIIEGNLRNEDVEMNNLGFIPYSLELIKLHKEGLSHTIDKNNKQLSMDIINVSFNQKVRNKDEIIKKIEAKIKMNINENGEVKDGKSEYINKLFTFIEKIKDDDESIWKGFSIEEVREKLYNEGFDLNGIHYVYYKRSSAKVRVGETLFINEKLFNTMIDYSRLYLDMSEQDIPSVMAYQSLINSSIIDTIKIKPEQILVINDYDSEITDIFDIIEQNNNGDVKCNTKEYTTSNSIWDGQSLIDYSVMGKYRDKGCLQMRQSLFKTCAFNTNISQFFKDNGVTVVTDMFGVEHKASKIKMITTPNSLKFLKFSSAIGTKLEMYDYWCEQLKRDKSIFGICKYEKGSKRGQNKGGILQQLSYQMLNSLNFNCDELNELISIESEYVSELKNDINAFLSFLDKNSNDMNVNKTMHDLVVRNRDFQHTKLFKDFRKKQINSYVSYLKLGKIRMNGDYCTMVGNPIEMLFACINNFSGEAITLKDNELYTPLFESDKELVAFRNPHTSTGSVFVCKNVENKLISEYMNLTDNIVVVNGIGYPIQDKLAGSDQDGDTICILNNDILLNKAKEYQSYRVCINNLNASKIQYALDNQSFCKIDSILSKSQLAIGYIVNTGALILAEYFNSDAKDDELYKYVQIMTIFSGVAIDLAKKLYNIDLLKETKTIARDKRLNKKPLFFQNISQSNISKNKMERKNCTMDNLTIVLSNLKRKKIKEDTINIRDLIEVKPLNGENRKQRIKMVEYAENCCAKINYINMLNVDSDEKNRMIDNNLLFFKFKFQKMKVRDNTIYALLKMLFNEEGYTKIQIRLLDLLYKTQGELLLNGFKSGE